MEKFAEYAKLARHNIKIADHMLTMTYPLVKDEKLLPAVLENIFLALVHAMASILAYERSYKRIPPFHDTFESKFSLFRHKIVPRFKLDLKMVRFIVEMKELVQEHKESPVEFVRRGTYVIADEKYQVRVLKASDLKRHLKTAKEITHTLLSLVHTHA